MAKSEGCTDVNMSNDVDRLVATVSNLSLPRSVKQAALARIREIETATGQRIYGRYNGASRNPSEMARMDEENAA